MDPTVFPSTSPTLTRRVQWPSPPRDRCIGSSVSKKRSSPPTHRTRVGCGSLLLRNLLCYGAFLINTVTWRPVVHFVVVGLFCVGFLLHAVAVVRCVVRSWSATVCLGVGGLAFLSLLVAPGHWFWAAECVGLSAMMLFTPIELFVARRHRLNALDVPTARDVPTSDIQRDPVPSTTCTEVVGSRALQ